jgi:hypothetical protein
MGHPCIAWFATNMSVTENKKGLPESYKLNMKSQKVPVKQVLKQHSVHYAMHN